HAGIADERRVRGEHDRLTRDRAAVRFHRHRSIAELRRRRLLEDQAAAIGDRLRERREVRARMKSRLAVEADAGPADQRHLIDELGVEAEILGERRLFTKRRGVAWAAAN